MLTFLIYCLLALAVTKCFFELLFVSQYFWISYKGKDFFWKNPCHDDNDVDCENQSSNAVGFLACLTQFSILANELYFLVITVDLHLACTNPFTSYKNNAKWYMFFVYGSAISTSVILGTSGRTVYGLSSDATVWIQVIARITY